MAKTKKKFITVNDPQKSTILNVQAYDQIVHKGSQIHFYKINKNNILQQVFSWDFETETHANLVFDTIINKLEQ